MVLSKSLVALSFATSIIAKEWHYGAFLGEPFDVTSSCNEINMVNPELFSNWGPDNRHKFGEGHIDVCGNNNLKFVPYLWGQDWDDPQLNNLPNKDQWTPWGVIFENEPNWWGGQPVSAGHGDGCNMTARAAAAKWKGHTDVINKKWGVGVVKLISPSPVNRFYPPCPGGKFAVGCAWQSQMDWFAEYFANCGTCYHDVWAINVHDYECNIEKTKQFLADVRSKYSGKNIFFGELGCNAPSPDQQAKFLSDWTAWAYNEPDIVGFMWAGINNVGTPNSRLTNNGQLTVVGNAFKQIQQKYPPKYVP